METVEDAVRAAYEKNVDEPQVDDTPAVPITESQQEVETEEQKAERLRDEKGRFAKKEEGEEKEVEVTEVVQEQQELQPVPIPNSLKAQYKAKWGTLPREWQEELVRIDQAGVKGAEHLKTAAKFGDEVMSVVKPYEHMILAEGGTPAAAIQDLLATAALFRRGTPEQKQQALMQIARQFNVPIGQQQAALFQPPQQPQTPQFDPLAHPAIRALMDKTEHLGKFVETHFEAQERQAYESNLNAVNAFLGKTDAQGNALYPLDESLEPAFAQEIGAVRSANPHMSADQVLAAAYDNLSWKTPEIREVRIARLEAEREAKRKAEQEKALAAKRKAAGSLTGSSTITAPATGGSIRDIVAAQVNQAGRI